MPTSLRRCVNLIGYGPGHEGWPDFSQSDGDRKFVHISRNKIRGTGEILNLLRERTFKGVWQTSTLFAVEFDISTTIS